MSDKKPDENTSVKVVSQLIIRDKDTKQVLVSKQENSSQIKKLGTNDERKTEQ